MNKIIMNEKTQNYRIKKEDYDPGLLVKIMANLFAGTTIQAIRDNKIVKKSLESILLPNTKETLYEKLYDFTEKEKTKKAWNFLHNFIYGAYVGAMPIQWQEKNKEYLKERFNLINEPIKNAEYSIYLGTVNVFFEAGTIIGLIQIPTIKSLPYVEFPIGIKSAILAYTFFFELPSRYLLLKKYNKALGIYLWEIMYRTLNPFCAFVLSEKFQKRFSKDNPINHINYKINEFFKEIVTGDYVGGAFKYSIEKFKKIYSKAHSNGLFVLNVKNVKKTNPNRKDDTSG